MVGKRAEPEIMAELPVPLGDGSFIMTGCRRVYGQGNAHVCKCARLVRHVCRVSLLMDIV